MTLAACYSEYEKILQVEKFDNKFAENNWGTFPAKISIEWMPYCWMFEEFSREIVNSLNQLVGYSHRLKIWKVILDTKQEKAKIEIIYEFVEPISTLALNLPYVIRSRFIFATAHLCHQANRVIEGVEWKDDLPFDKAIYFEQADKYGQRWSLYNKLKTSLEETNSKKYCRDTKDFRNTYNHRFSPHVESGITNIVIRQVDSCTNCVSYDFGGTQPLPLGYVIEQLNQQYARFHKSLDAFKALVQEHSKTIWST